MTSDICIIGSGIAGLTLACKLAEARPDLRIVVITKTVEQESNTRYAQGGVAAVWDFEKDSYHQHIADTLDAGDGLCRKDIVDIVITEGPERVRDIIRWGARFDVEKQTPGEYDLAKEGGHSANRILHYKDLTGWEMQRTLTATAERHPNIQVLEHYFAIDLITQHHLGYQITRVTPGIQCYGIYALNKKTNKIETFPAKMTVICTGGAGQVYKTTTNPVIATGDGMAMMYRAKGRMANMEFVQFHPTALYNPGGDNPAFLISEAVRGAGAILRDVNGQEFMHKYDSRLSLAPRDIVARAIDNEMKIHGSEHVYLDCRHLDPVEFKNHFPTILDKCLSIGIEPDKQLIPVVPACHYMCGGVWIDAQGATSIQNLYAAGECTCSGLHGANRLASNSLLEAMVFAHRIAQEILLKVDHCEIQTRSIGLDADLRRVSGVEPSVGISNTLPDWDASGTTEPKELVLITQSLKELKEIMSSYVGIVRSNERLTRALNRLYLLYEETETLYHSTIISPQLCELRNLITIAYLITRSASLRQESRGLHYNTDYPNKNPFVEDTFL